MRGVTKYPDLEQEIAAMEVGDCLRWTDMPPIQCARDERTFLYTVGRYARIHGMNARRLLHRREGGAHVLYVIRVE